MLLVATVLKGLCVIAQDVLVGTVIERTVADLREELFAHTLKLDVQTLGASNTGDLMSRFTNDLQQLANGLRLMGGKVVREPLKAVACVIGASAGQLAAHADGLHFGPAGGGDLRQDRPQPEAGQPAEHGEHGPAL